MTTEKQRLIDLKWRNPTQDPVDGTWHGMWPGQGGWWLCHDLLQVNGKRRDEWFHDEDYQRALDFLAALKVSHRFTLTAEDWGQA